MTIATYSTLAPQVVNGRVVIIGLGSAKPNPAYPDIKPMSSVAPGFDVGHWYGIFAPKGTPDWLIERLNKEINEAVKVGQVKDLVEADGASPQNVSVEEFGRRVRSDYSMWKKIAADRKIVVE
jgi:tripartite-type tricarboxylate transporter receptor subunit TctC